MILAKKWQLFLYLHLVKIRQEILLSDLAEKKKPFLAIKNRIFQSLKNRTFPKGLTHGFGRKMPIMRFI